MSFPNPPHFARDCPEDLDRLLRDFFHAELPASWPVPEPPARAVPMRPVRRPLYRSRFVLAASVALLLGGNLFLSSRFLGEDPTGARPGRGELIGSREKISTSAKTSPDPETSRPKTASPLPRGHSR